MWWVPIDFHFGGLLLVPVIDMRRSVYTRCTTPRKVWVWSNCHVMVTRSRTKTLITRQECFSSRLRKYRKYILWSKCFLLDKDCRKHAHLCKRRKYVKREKRESNIRYLPQFIFCSLEQFISSYIHFYPKFLRYFPFS